MQPKFIELNPHRGRRSAVLIWIWYRDANSFELDAHPQVERFRTSRSLMLFFFFLCLFVCVCVEDEKGSEKKTPTN